ncbi:MAG: DUF1444 family protein [Paracoccaceae bacterium]
MIRLFLACILMLHVSAAAAESPPQKNYSDTLALMRDAYLTHDEVANAVINTEDQSLLVTMKGGLEVISYPDNLHLQLNAAKTPEERAKFLQKFIAAGLDSASRDANKSPQDSKNLLPIIRPTAIASGQPTVNMARLPFAADLSIFFVFESANDMSYAQQKDVAALASSGDELLTLALKNFAAKNIKPKIEGKNPYFVVLDGNYEATVLLDTAFWDKQDETLGQIIVAPIARDLVVFADRSIPGQEHMVRWIVNKYFDQSAYPLTDKMFSWVDHRWVELPE